MSKPFFLICFLFGLFSFRPARTQGITLNRDHATLPELLVQIHEQAGYFFVYSENVLADAKTVSIHVSKAPVEEVLDICFAGQPLVYRIDNKIITVQRKPSLSKVLVDVRGRVLTEEGDPLEEVSVEIAASHRAVSTNSDGEFSFEKLPEESVLVFSHVGFQTQTLTLSGNLNLTVILKRSVNRLDEVQVIAYGSTTQRLSTGSIAKLSAPDIEKQPVNDPLASLVGRLPGVFVQQASGVPGGAFDIQIRGHNSVRPDGNNPLYIVDGVQFGAAPLDNPYTSTGGVQSSALNNLNPSDIESITVLKDADATAIYGSRGANGVVLITTKKGKAGSTRLDLDFAGGFENITRRMQLLNTEEYLNMRKEAFSMDAQTPSRSSAPDLLVWNTSRYTNWQKYFIGNTARRDQASVSVSGGDRHTQFLFGASYVTESTVMPGNFSDKKGSAHFNLHNSSENEKFQTSLAASFIQDDRYMPQADLISRVRLAPDAPPVYDSLGNLNWASSTWVNPAQYLMQTNRGKTANLLANLLLSYDILPGLQVKTSLGYNKLELTQVGVSPLSSLNPAFGYTSGYTYFSDNKVDSWVAEPEIQYKRNFGRLKLQAQLGSTVQENTSTSLNQYGQGFSSDKELQNLQAASSVLVLSAATTNYRYIGFYSRVNVNWREKYLLNLTARRDGSSRFGKGRQFGNFGALGLGWIFTQEPGFRSAVPWLSFGKLRASYGTAGNDQIADYGYLDSYSPTGFVYGGVSVLAPQNLANADYSWETIRKAELGLQTGFIKDHILFTVSYYQNRSSNQLVGYSLPAITGFTSVQANLPAVVENSGWEMELNTINLHRNHFTWTSSANLTIPRNRLIAYPNLAASSYANNYVVGKSLYIAKVYKNLQVDPQTGHYLFYDYNKDGVISYPKDAQDIRKKGYDFYGGIGNAITYKQFQLDFFVQFVRQVNINYISSFVMPGSFSSSATSNQPVEVLKRWLTAGQLSAIQRFSRNSSSDAGIAYSNLKNSDQDYTDASFVRIKNIAFSYSIPEELGKALHIRECRIYLQFQNLFTFTRYNGFDPETGSGLPPLKNITAGIHLGL